jgi:hypothetical protein
MRIRIRAPAFHQGICDHWHIDPLGLCFGLHAVILSIHGPPRLHFGPRKLLHFDFVADLGPDLDAAFHSNADTDPDPASKNNANPKPCISESGPDQQKYAVKTTI